MMTPRLLSLLATFFCLAGVAHADGYPSSGPCEDVAACEAACQAGKLPSCTWGGFLLLQRPFEEDREPRALALFTPACAKGDAESCWQAAKLEEGQSSSEEGPAHAKRIAASYHRACAKGHIRACVSEGYWLGVPGTPAAKRAATAVYKKAASTAERRCLRGKEALLCDWVAGFWGGGYYLPKDMARYERFRQRACQLERGAPCPD